MTSVVIDMIARDRFSAQFIKAGTEAETLAKKVSTTGSKIGSALKVGAAVGLTAVVALGGASVELASKYEDAQKRLEAALKASGTSFDALKRPIATADKAMEKLGFTNTQTADALANLTVATKNPTKSLQLLGVTADLARFKHITLAEAATAVGKAMAGNLRPIKQLGIDLPVAASSALKVATATENLRKAQDAYNVALATYQKTPTAANMAKMQAAAVKLKTAHENLNKTTSASNIILQTLSQRLGGQAQASASTLAGKVEVLRARFEDMGVKVGTVLIPVLLKLVNGVSSVTDWMQKHTTVVKAVAIVLGTLLVVAIGHVIVAWLALNLAFLATPIGLIIAGLVALGAAVFLLVKNWNRVMNDLKTFTLAVWNAVTGFIRDHWKAIVVLLTGGLGALAVFIITHWNQIKNTTIAVWDAVTNFIRDHWRIIVAVITGPLGALVVFIASNWGRIRDTIVGAMQAALNFLRGVPGTIKGYFAGAIGWLYQAGKDVLQGFWNGLKFIWDKVTGFVGGIVGWIKDHKGPISLDKQLLEPAGRALMQGLVTGLMSGFTNVVKFVGGIAGWVAGQVGSIAGGFAGGNQGTGSGAGAGGASGSLASWITSALMITGTPLSWGAAIQRRIMFESGGNPNAINLTDINAQQGHPSQGLMQTIPSTFFGNHQPGTSMSITDPVANIAAAINYIKGRYGTIFAIDPPVQGYESGAWNIARNQLAYLHRGEMVVPENVAKDVRGGGDMVGAIRAGLAGMEFRFDGDGLARLVTSKQTAYAVRGGRR